MNRLAPGVPPDYYDTIYSVELDHWWQRGMRRLSTGLLGDRLTRPGLALLDVGCGTGGFLHYALKVGSPARLAGVDVSVAAVELAQTRVPEAELSVAPAWDTGLEDATFDLAVMNDVLQHLPEDRVSETVRELRRVLKPGGAVLVRTGGARRLRRERDDWRAYDRRTLRQVIERAGFACERVTYVNVIPSLWALAHGTVPHAPTDDRHGVPRQVPGRLPSAVAYGLLEAEARYLHVSRRSLPYGHTLLAVAIARA